MIFDGPCSLLPAPIVETIHIRVEAKKYKKYQKMLNELTHKDTLIVKNTRQHRRSLGQGEGCVCANAGKAGRGRVAL